jgi:Mrp family chromosome partitioning ATPase
VPVDEIDDAQLSTYLARGDLEFASLVELLQTTKRDLLVMATRVGPRHREYMQLSRQAESAERQVADRLAAFRSELKEAEIAAATASVGPDGTAATDAPPRAPLTLIERLEAEEEEISGEIAALATKLQNVQAYLEEAERLDAEIATTSQRLESLRFERQNQSFGRITIEEYAAAPTSPSTDRRVPLSAAGAAAGIGGGLGLIVLFGMLRPAIRYSNDASDLRTTTPLLAAIPDVSSGDPESRHAAAFSVHHLRHLIEASTGNRPLLSLAITSPGPGDGKTQLALGLAASFASAGRRVLAIDLDFVGRGLTRATDLEEAPGVAQHLATASPIDGLLSRVDDHPFAVLPAGQPGPDFAASLDTARIRAILAAQRGQFDVIIIDTGPILGSLEAGAVVGATDACLMVVGRGQKSALVQAALARITALGGKSLGLVFNRASSMDVNGSVGSMSLRSSSTNGHSALRRNAKPSLYKSVSRASPDATGPT